MLSNEPAVKTGVLVSGVGAVLALLVAFGVSLSADQTAAILGVALFLQPYVQSLLTRYQVSPHPRAKDLDETPDDAVMP